MNAPHSSFIPPPSSLLLHSMYIRSPDVLVDLQLHAHVQAALGYPPGQLLQIDLLPCGGNQNRFRSTLEFVFINDASRKVPVRLISDDELDLVAFGSQPPQIRPVISFGFA